MSAAPNLTVTMSADDAVLVGEPTSVSVEVTNNTSTPGYNTGVAVVLPSGVTFSAAGIPPQILDDTPAGGQTTLWFENVNDSQPFSAETISFSVISDTTSHPVGSSFVLNTTAYTSDDPRVIPTANGSGSTGSGVSSSTTAVTAITIDKAQPNPEGEVMRGVHDHDIVYTLTIENNPANPTNSVIVDDYLPAGLEFLGCGTLDNTTDAPTNSGNNVEYPGASRLDASTDDLTVDCPIPTLVETVEVDPDGTGPLPFAIYTHVQWDLGNFTTGETKVINYAAGIPILENTLTFTAPADTLGQQTANLDNNSGPETSDEQLLQNGSEVAGTYTGLLALGATNPVGDSDVEDVTAEDIRLLKSVNPDNVEQGTDTLWTLTISTSEYRTADDLVLTDSLPDGHCPLSASTNYDGSETDCVPGGVDPSLPYSSVTENTDGTWTLVWSNIPDLGASANFVLTFPSRVRTYYQEGGSNTDPVVTNDGFTNTAALTADDRLIAGIPATEVDDQPDTDSSSASQGAVLPTIEKTISAPAAPGASLDCSTATYIDADDRDAAPFAYRPGDIVCYTLRVDVPANLTLRDALVSDFMPAGVTLNAYLGATANNDIGDVTGPVNFNNGVAAAVGDSTLAWEIGTVAGTDGARYLGISAVARVWEVRFIAEFTGAPTGDGSSLEKANLMKLTTTNSAGAALSLRDQATFIAVEPELTIDKSNDASGPVTGADSVDYTVTVTNVADTGGGSPTDLYAAAAQVVIEDDLPAPLVCSDVTIDPVTGVTSLCSTNQIEWTIASLVAGDNIDLTYTLDVPDLVAPGRTYTNTATVASFEQTNNDGGTTTYTPGTTDTSDITTPEAVPAKIQQSSVSEAGNFQNTPAASTDEEATIGELVDFDLNVDIPAGVTVHDAFFLDQLPTDMTVVGAVTATYDNDISDGAPAVAVPTAGFSFNGTDPLRIDFPSGAFTNAAGSGAARVTLSFSARVDDVGANVAGAELDNRGQLRFRPTAGAGLVSSNGSYVTTTVVEPDPQITKDEDILSDIVGPGDVINYTLQITNPNGADVSVAHDLQVIDVLPTRVTPTLPIPNGGDWDSGARTITWDAADLGGSLDPGAAAIVLTYQVTTDDPLPVGSTLDNTADVFASSMAGTVANERTTYNDEATDSLTTQTVAFTKSLVPDAGPYTIGETVNYQLVTTLPQDSIAFDMTVSDVVPDGLVFDSATINTGPNCSVVGDTELLLVGANLDGSTETLFFLGDVTAISGSCVFTIDTTAHVDSAYDGTGSPVAGTAITAGVTLTNAARTNWMLTDTVTSAPSSAADLPSGWDDQTAVDSETITVSEPQLAIDKDVTSVSGCDAVHDAALLADDDACEVEPGQSTLTYTITVENTGTEAAHDVVVVDQPDVELETVTLGAGSALNTDNWTVGDPDLRWDLPGPVAPGATVTLTYTADLVGSALLGATSIVSNTADVNEYFGLDSVDRAATTNERTYGTAYGAVPADTVDLTVDFPDLSVAKTVASGAESAEAVVGTDFGWRVTVTNNATTATAVDVDVTDTLPPNWDLVDGTSELCSPACVSIGDPAESGTLATGLQLDWTDLADLAPGQSVEIRFDAVPRSGALIDPGSNGTINHVNTALATADDATGASSNADGVYQSGTDTANGVIYEADVRLDKQIVTAGPYLSGQTVVYRVVVDNDGPDAAVDVTVDEILDGGALLYGGTVSVDGSYNSGSGVWTLPTPLPNGGQAVLELQAILDRGGSITNTAQVMTAGRFDTDSTPGNGVGAEDDQDSITIAAGTASLGSTVWFDIDNSGGDETTKGTEPGIGAVTVTLLAAGNDDIFGTTDDYWGPDGDAGGTDNITTTSAVTDSSGNYAFTDLPDGRYRVEVDPDSLPQGSSAWSQTYDDNASLDHTTGDIVLSPSADSYVDADFSYTGTASLGDQLWWDVDQSADGTYDNGGAQDQPIPAVDVGLIWAGFDNTFGTADDVSYPDAATGSAGDYSFGMLAPGEYRTTVNVNDPDFPDGLSAQTWDVVHNSPGGGDGEPVPSVDVSLAGGENRTDVDFSFSGSGSIGDTLWIDADGDGSLNGTEVGIPGVTVTLVWFGVDNVLGGGDDRTLTRVTGSDGTYGFDGLPAGDFEITVDVLDSDFPTGVSQTYDLDGLTTPDVAVVSLAEGENRLDVDFGYQGLGSLGDTVWLDLDGDGAINGPEVGIPGVMVTAVWAGADGVVGTIDDLTLTTITASDGTYNFAGLPYGDSEVRVTSLPAVSQTFDLDGLGSPDTATVTLTSSAPDRLDVDFGYRGDAELGDTVWIDTDADGTISGDESGLDGVEVEITLAGVDGLIGTTDDLVISVETTGGGGYGLTGLPAGPVHVELGDGVPADHVTITDPDSTVDGMWDGTLAPGGSNLDIDFGIRPDADLSVIKSHSGDFTIDQDEIYTITISNAGPATATGVTLTDVLPAGLDYESATGASCEATGQVVTCAVDDLATGESLTVALTVAVDLTAAPSVINTVVVSSDTPDRDESNNTDADPTDVPLAQLVLDKTLLSPLEAGETADYRLTVTNEGPSPAEGVTLTDPLTEDLTFVSATGTGWTCTVTSNEVVECNLAPDLAVGSTTVVDLVVSVSAKATGPVTNQATVATTTHELVLSDDLSSVTGTVQQATSTLAFTGSATRMALSLAAALLTIGLALLTVGRRRKRAVVRVQIDDQR